jgi:ABC-2 type transport system permease protein
VKANLRAVYIIWYRDLLRFWRDRARIVSALAQPLMFLALLGPGLSAGMGIIGRTSLGQVIDYVTFLYPGIIGMTVLFTAVFSAVSIVWDREFGFLKEVLVAPVSRAAVAVGKALGGSTIAMAQGAILLAFAPLVGISLSPGIVARLLPLMFLMAFAITSLGLVIAARLRTMESFHMLMNFILMPMFFLSGALFPLQNLPDWLSILTKLNPVTYGVNPIRWVLLQTADLPSQVLPTVGFSLGPTFLSLSNDVVVLGAFAVVMIVLAMRAFNLQE